MGRENAQFLNEPVIERTVHIELEGADGMCDMLDGVALAVGVVVHRIDAPFVAGTVMGSVDYAVHNRVPEHHILVRHIDFSTQDLLPVSIFAIPHFPEKAQVLFNAPVPVRTVLAGLVHRSPTDTDFFLRLVVHIGQTLAYEFFGPFVELLEIVGSIPLLSPLEPEPFDVFLYGIHIFRILFNRIGVIKTEICLSAVLQGETEIGAYTLGMSYVQVTVGLRRETCDYAIIFSGGQVSLDDFFEKVQLPRLFSHRHFVIVFHKA